MAPHIQLTKYSLIEGMKVRLLADDETYRCEGIIQRIDHNPTNPFIILSQCTDVVSQKMELGPQRFTETAIQKLEIVSVPNENDDESEESSTVKPTVNRQQGYSKPLIRNRGYNDNPHLKRLHSVQMAELLSQVQIEPAPTMVKLDLEPGKPRLLVFPEQHAEHMEGEQFRNRQMAELAAVRDIFWKDSESPAPLKLFPEKLYVITVLKSKEFSDAVEELWNENMIGVSLEGQCLGRRGTLSLLAFATKKKVFLFDIVQLGPESFDQGIREILESPQIIKIFHDVRQPSDILFHKYEVTLVNIYDTMATHSIFLSWTLYCGHLPKYAHSYANLVRAYFGVKGSDLFFPHYRISSLKEDTKIWLQRPLLPDLEMGAVRNVAYLLDLHRATKECSLEPLIRATNCLLQYVRDADDPDADSRSFESHVLPNRFQECLPQWAPDAKRASKYGVVEREQRVVHNFVGQMDPNLIFSRDCIHQNKAEKQTV